MAWTAMHSEALKRNAGISLAGRSQQAGSVFSYSLAWHTEQQPDTATMQTAAHATLAVLGLTEHEAVIVAHGDTDHAHVHVIVNLVHPEKGTIANLSYTQRRLQAWASEYEKAHGKIYCEEREKNAQRRERGEITKHQDEKVQDAATITALYQQADTGAAFVSALSEAGYTLAHGDKGRLVLIGADGKAQNLVRQIDGVKRKEIEAKLASVLEKLPTATEALAQRRASPADAAKEPAAEPTPDVPSQRKIVTASHIVTVGQRSPEQRYEARIKAHVVQLQRAENEEVRDVLRMWGAWKAVLQPLIVHAMAEGVAQHLERIAGHITRLVQWVCDKPQEYLDDIRNLTRARAREEEEKTVKEEMER
jgi:hypothetical protein